MDFQLSLKNESVASVELAEPLAATCDATIGLVLELMRTQHVGVVLLFEDDRLAGIFTERDALRVMHAGLDLAAPVSTVMSTEVDTLDDAASVGEAIRTMSEGGYRHLPILDRQGQPSGVLMVQGIVHYLVELFPDTVYNLPPTSSEAQASREGA
jgi:CBS domain-containing protein